MSAESQIAALKLQLPNPPKAGGIYKPVVQVGNICYVSGHGPLKVDGTLITGKVGAEVTEEQAKEAAKVTGLALLASLKAHLGSLDRVVRLVKSLGMVNAVPDFSRHPQVINGYSELMREIFGENGVGARSAVGMGSLPGNISVEIEAIFEVVG